MKSLKAVIWLALLAAVIYVGVKMGMPYFRYYAFESDVQELVGISIADADSLRDKVMEKAWEYDIPIQSRDVNVSGRSGAFKVYVAWAETVNIFDLYAKTYEFTVDVSRMRR
jgi:hypothetical protein